MKFSRIQISAAARAFAQARTDSWYDMVGVDLPPVISRLSEPCSKFMGEPLFRALVRRAPGQLDTQLRSYAIYGTEPTYALNWRLS